jgi:ribonuclease-3
VFRRFLSVVKFRLSDEREFYDTIVGITGVCPSNLHHYKLAFKHSSLMLRDERGTPLNNERLEFLGDAVLGNTIALHLFNKFPDKDEGFLTIIRSRIVSRTNLNDIALKMGIDKLIQTKPPNKINNTHIPGDALEALIGAIYLDLGNKTASKFIKNKILSEQIDLKEILKKDTNYKSHLVEWAQKYKYEINYVTEEFSSPLINRKTFKAKVFVNEILFGEGKGNSKKEAQQNAACKSFDTIRKKYPKLIN